MYGFRVILSINRDYFLKQRQPPDVCSGQVLCFLCGTDWILKYYLEALRMAMYAHETFRRIGSNRDTVQACPRTILPEWSSALVCCSAVYAAFCYKIHDLAGIWRHCHCTAVIMIWRRGSSEVCSNRLWQVDTNVSSSLALLATYSLTECNNKARCYGEGI
jgi:hypothetical protein